MAVVKANYVRRGKGERVTAKANIRYIQERQKPDAEREVGHRHAEVSGGVRDGAGAAADDQSGSIVASGR